MPLAEAPETLQEYVNAVGRNRELGGARPRTATGTETVTGTDVTQPWLHGRDLEEEAAEEAAKVEGSVQKLPWEVPVGSWR